MLWMNSKLEKKDAQDKIVNFIAVIEQMQSKVGISNSVLLKQFSDSKYGELIDLLKDYPDNKIFERLKKIDPQHAAKYEEMLR